ncbi:hypothetical protein V8G54_010087, partial [Vigna mungo]
DAGNLRTLVHDAKNILGVEEEPVETGGEVAPASGGNQAATLSQRLTRKKRVGWEIEALPYHNLRGTVPAFEEYEVPVVVQTQLDLVGFGGGVGGPHLELASVCEYEVTGGEKG